MAEDVESYDEEEMYGEGTTFVGVKEEDDGFQVEEGKQMTETLIIFERNQFLLIENIILFYSQGISKPTWV